MGPSALFGTIYEFHYIISANFYLYLQYFQQKVFSFSFHFDRNLSHLHVVWNPKIQVFC